MHIAYSFRISGLPDAALFSISPFICDYSWFGLGCGSVLLSHKHEMRYVANYNQIHGVAMSNLLKQKEKIEKEKERLKQKERLIRLKEQKEESKKIFEAGKLLKKAKLLSEDPKVLLGALLEVSQEIADEKRVEKWKEKADQFQDKGEGKSDAVIVTFDKEPSTEAKAEIKKLGLRWNKFRNEWYGYASINDAKSSLEQFDAYVTAV